MANRTTRMVVDVHAWCAECGWEGTGSGDHLSLPDMQRRARNHAIHTGHMAQYDVQYAYIPETSLSTLQ